jgi:hypothetical protein
VIEFDGPLDRDSLRMELDGRDVDPDSYYLDGGHPPESYVLEDRRAEWVVYTGRTKLTGQGRPGLRLAAWRAVWGAQRANPVYRARYQHLIGREKNKLRPTQAQTIIAAAILRHLHAVTSTGQARDPVIATHGSRHQVLPAAA